MKAEYASNSWNSLNEKRFWMTKVRGRLPVGVRKLSFTAHLPPTWQIDPGSFDLCGLFIHFKQYLKAPRPL